MFPVKRLNKPVSDIERPGRGLDLLAQHMGEVCLQKSPNVWATTLLG